MIPLYLVERIMNTIPYKRYTTSFLKQSHIAIVFKRKKILSIGLNKVGTRSRGCGWNDLSIHAEVMAIKNMGDISKLRGASILVVRINALDEFVYSKPCTNCTCFLEKCMKQYGLEKVYYS